MHDNMARKIDHNIILWFGLVSNHPKYPTTLQEKAVMGRIGTMHYKRGLSNECIPPPSALGIPPGEGTLAECLDDWETVSGSLFS